MDALVLSFRDEPVREFVLEGAPLEVGSAPGCDIVVYDPDVVERHLLVQERGGTVYVHALRDHARAWRHLPPNQPLPLGRWHSLTRIAEAPQRSHAARSTTEPLRASGEPDAGLSLVVGRGIEARRFVLGRTPLSAGTSDENELVLVDRTVSRMHCRFEPCAEGWRVRDLGSRNGTHVDGVRVALAGVAAGTTVRVGRTDLRVVSREPSVASGGLVAASASMQEVLAKVERFARYAIPVLVVGESGAGKEGIAKELHRAGPRAARPFVAINAGGMAGSLIESELFGHERGAFTGAHTVHRGVFEQADGGTLFLDEIGELPLDLQARLLRVLETGEVRRVGSERTVKVDVRVVCATHRDLSKMVAYGSMRQDLYFRLAVLTIQLPPLRDRPEDIQALAAHFLARAAEQLGPRALSRDAVTRLLAHPWPGNARELRNVVLRAAAGSAGSSISAEDVAQALAHSVGPPRSTVSLDTAASVRSVLELHHGNLSAAARALGLPRETLRDRLKRGSRSLT